LTDALTGISNRRSFDMRLQDELTSHKESGATLSLLMLDIDHFNPLSIMEWGISSFHHNYLLMAR